MQQLKLKIILILPGEYIFISSLYSASISKTLEALMDRLRSWEPTRPVCDSAIVKSETKLNWNWI